MATIETNVFRDGQWQTSRRTIQSFLKENARSAPPAPDAQDKRPSCGILTKTVVQSPVVHRILPARLRSTRCNDVAFVGDYHVQINELRDGGELHQIARKQDFDARIVNSCVIGNTFERVEEKQEDGDIDMIGLSRSKLNEPSGTLPPHILFLILESGAFVFLFLRDNGGPLEFVTSVFHPEGHILGRLGHHVTVDPSSRYAVVASAENKVIVFELEPWGKMNLRYQKGCDISPIRYSKPRAVQGLISHVEFLHPRPQDDYHVILLLIVTRRQGSSMVLYDWELDEDLEIVLADEKIGHRLPKEHRMPQFIVPLTIRNAFLAVSDNSIGFCKDPLQGPPVFEFVDSGSYSSTGLHHGQLTPLWTAWDRPVRRRNYYNDRDNIYLAREDGVIVFLELNKYDIVGAAMNVGTCNCNVSSAFTTMYGAFDDIAIIAGESGPGVICQLKPRQLLVELGTIPNWAPTLDFVTTDQFTTWNQETGSAGKRMLPWRDQPRPNTAAPDRIFCTSGKGIRGSITELRHGLAANIGWDIAYGSPIQRAWIFESNLPGIGPGHYLILTLPDSTDILQFVGGSLDETRPDLEAQPFDVTSRTLAAAKYAPHMILQVTETSINMVGASQSYRRAYTDYKEVKGEAVQAVVRGHFISIATHHDGRYHVYTFKAGDLDLSLVASFEAGGEVTTLALCSIAGRDHVLAGVWRDGHPFLAAHAFDADNETAPRFTRLDDVDASTSPPDGVDPPATARSETVDTASGIAVLTETESVTMVTLGSRSGHLITVQYYSNTSSEPTVLREKFSHGAIDVYPCENNSVEAGILVCCDGNLLLLQDFDQKHGGRFKSKQHIVPNDAQTPEKAAPPIHYVMSVGHGIGQDDQVPLLLLSGDRVLVAEMSIEAKAVPRTLSLGGTPTRLLFSKTLQCLIVGLRLPTGETTIKFIDPNSGDDLSRPTHRDMSVPFIKGLGANAGKIYDMVEWYYEKEGKTWLFIVLATSSGQLVIISTQRIKELDSDGNEVTKIQYWTRYKKSLGEPVYSVVGDGANLLYCAGKMLFWEVLDPEKKLKPRKEFELPSLATSLQIVNGKIHALTYQHSLQVIDHRPARENQEMTSVHSDVGIRHARHYIEMGDSRDETASWPVVLICEQTHEFVGARIPLDEPQREFQIVFEGKLPVGVKKLRRGHVRPTWKSGEKTPKYGRIASTIDGADVLGMGLDGSVHHFTLLSMEAWRVLRIVQRLAKESPLVCPYERRRRVLPAAANARPSWPGGDEEADSPEKLHIEGDILQRCLERRALGLLLANDPEARVLLRESLDGLEGGKWTVGFGGDDQRYLELAYEVVEHFVAPMF